MASLVEVTKTLTFLAALYPRYALTEETIDAYHVILQDLGVGLLKAAAMELGSQDRPFFPSAGELRQAAFDLVARSDGLPTAGEAWAEVCRKIGEDGHIRVPEFSHPLVKQAVDGVGGWLNLCWSVNQVADRARFMEVYKVLMRRRRSDERMLPQVRETAAALAGREAKRLEGGE
jgi:hypothetical protein